MFNLLAKRRVKWRSPLWIVLVTSLSTVGGLRTASAHGVGLEYQSTEAIEVRGMYDSGEPMADAQVAVYAPDDASTPWLTGTADSQGVFLFQPDPSKVGDWEVQFRQAGHGEVLIIPTGEVADATSSSLVSPGAQSSSLSPVQRLLVLGSVVWGFVGTALYFSARRQQKSPVADANLQSTSNR